MAEDVFFDRYRNGNGGKHKLENLMCTCYEFLIADANTELFPRAIENMLLCFVIETGNCKCWRVEMTRHITTHVQFFLAMK